MGRGSISLHPKYGVNPSMGICFICGADTGEILLLGNNRGKEAPRYTISGALCPQCQQAVNAGAVMLVEVKDGEEKTILNKKVTFFDIGSTKAKQFGFQMIYDGGKVLTCCGDEPYNECEEKYAKGSDWMFHEAFCLYGQRDIFNPYEKHHSTVKDASELAENLGVKNLVLYHTEDKNIKKRKELYGAEGREYYHGNLFVPDDLDVIEM